MCELAAARGIWGHAMPWENVASDTNFGLYLIFLQSITAYHKSVSNSMLFFFEQKSGIAIATIAAAVPTFLYTQPKIHRYTRVTVVYKPPS